ncbi:MAG: hypothetical protein IT337_12610 [Thermomicrobiales bacterium]|nr:hypothetical protein [Thermomicrobiales bacterium]
MAAPIVPIPDREERKEGVTRTGVSLEPDDKEIADELARLYHGENVSRLIRHLLRVAWENPEIAKAA